MGSQRPKREDADSRGSPSLSGQCMNSPRATPAPETHIPLKRSTAKLVRQV